VTFSSTEFGYLLALEPGDEIIRCLIRFAREHELDAAVLSGIGSLAELEVGAGARDSASEATRRIIAEPLETCSLHGTLTLVDGEPFPHVHGSFARRDLSVIGGHVFQAVCAGAVEIAVHVCDAVALHTDGPPHTRTFP
jgi:uncharacterized protein